MSNRLVFGTATCIACLGWSSLGLAAGGARLHLGLETSLLSTYSVSGTREDDSYTSYRYEVSSTQYGLFGSGAAILGVLVNDRFDFGTRFAFRSGSATHSVDNAESSTDSSEVALDPYLAILTGTRGDTVRVAFGGTVGFGKGSETSKTPDPDSEVETELDTSSTRFGALFGLRLFPNDIVSVEPTLLVTKSWVAIDPGFGNNTDLSGMSAVLTLGVSFWMGGSPASSTAPVATAFNAAPAPERVVAAAPAPSEPRRDRTSVTLEEGRVLGLVLVEGGAERSMKLILRESLGQAKFLECESVVLHGPSSEDVSVATVAAKAGTATNTVPVLRGQVPITTLSQVVSSHSSAASVTPEHWIDVCGARWYLYDGARNKIAEFLRNLPPPPAPAVGAPSSATPATVPEASATDAPAAVPPPSSDTNAPAANPGSAL